MPNTYTPFTAVLVSMFVPDQVQLNALVSTESINILKLK